MFFQNKKYHAWRTKDFVWSIIHFLLHVIILTALVAFAIFINLGSFQATLDFIVDKGTYFNAFYVGVTVLLLATVVYLYFFFESRDFLLRAKNIAIIFIAMEISYIICIVLGRYVGIFARPYAIYALLILLLVNKPTAIFMNFIFNICLLISDIFSGVDVGLIKIIGSFIIGLSTSHLAVYLVDNVSSRIKVFGMGFINSIPIIGLSFLFSYESGMKIYDVLFIVLHGFISGIGAVVAMMAILPVFEAIFNVLTNYRLAEITDHKSKLIRKMITDAGGTFQHSILVATLAETCATAIGENPLLARAAAYYHDMGKIKEPQYFTENQHGYNPHDDLTPELSTQIIRAHTTNGSELIKKYHLPLILADVAQEHHGTLPIQYFYNKALKFTEGELDIKDYSYPGPKPSSKIAAIIMLADGCEAAVRAQSDRSRERVEKVVKAIIDDRMKLDQFSDCDITMHEIKLIQEALEDGLSGVYHDRIKYPKMKDKKVNTFASSKDGKNGQA